LEFRVMTSGRYYICGVWVILGWFWFGSLGWAGQTRPETKHSFREGLSLYQKGAFQLAEEHLEAVYRRSPEHEGVRYYLARIYIKLGDRSQKDFDKQRYYYKRALEVDPRLLEDSSFVKRYRQLQLNQSSSTTIQRKHTPHQSPKSRLFSFGVGLTLGVEGLLGVQTGVLIAGFLNPLFTFLPLQQSFDFSLKVIPLRRFDWSPFISAGITVPLNSRPVHPLPLYREPFLHVAIGVQYISPIGFTFSSGISLSYHFEKTAVFSFIPVPSAQISWYF